MRWFVAAVLLGVAGFSWAQTPHATALGAIRSWAPAGTEPVIAEQRRAAPAPHNVAAIVQFTASAAMLVVAGEVRPGAYAIVAKSKPFALSREANFGSWVEEFVFNPPDRIELSLGSRNGCARKVATHRFVLRNGAWMVSGLDVVAMRCTERGVEQAFAESANYLTGKMVRTTFEASKPPKSAPLASPRKSFPLSEFPPNGPEAAYAELQQ